MAEEQVGGRRDGVGDLMPWTKLFTAFKVALDPKKLLLAGAGILAMSFGWWLLSWIFFSFNSRAPEWTPGKYEDEKAAWESEKLARIRWNLLHELAAPVPADISSAPKVDAFDLASSPQEYRQIVKKAEEIKARIEGKRGRKIVIAADDAAWTDLKLLIGQPSDYAIAFQLEKKDDLAALKDLLDKDKSTVTAKDIEIDLKAKRAKIRGIVLINLSENRLKQLADELEGSTSLRDIEAEMATKKGEEREIIRKALLLVDPTKVRYKPAGKLSTWPWFEYRGPNPYLLVTGNVQSEGTDGSVRAVPWQRGEFIGWLMSDQGPVLLEPLIKFLTPILALFDAGSGGWNRLYLFLAIFWSLAVWALFGGAITRIAVVQIARPNEKVGMAEAVRFVWARYRSYLSAPLFPLLFIVLLTVFLIFFGWVEAFTVFLGDIFIVGLFWPLILIVGLIMAVVLVGLVGWPLMYPTISAEGSDSFDAISRSYSYVYQAPWQYVWYAFLAILYGAVLIFFVGFMGSLMVYLSKWGVSQAPWTGSREPTYLFVNAPTSFGWRDLLLRGHPDAQTREVIRNDGTTGQVVRMNDDYMSKMTWYNDVGAFFVSVWIYILFLMVVGFGYSYFWSASSIIYFLMRKKVDDTEFDEVHLEEEEFEEPYPKPAPTAPAAAPRPAPAPTGGPVMVESPMLKQPTPPAPTPTPAPAPKTQLATDPLPDPKENETPKPSGEAGDKPASGEGDAPK